MRAHYVELVDGLLEQAVLDVTAALAEVVGFEAIGPAGYLVLLEL